MPFENAARLQEIKSEMQRLENEAIEVRASLVKEILDVMQQYGITVDDLTTKAPVQRRDRRPAKYANPNGAGTWSGAGRPPKWYKDAVDQGVDPESMLIRSTTM